MAVSTRSQSSKTKAPRRRDSELNQAPVMWGRRLARLVGRRYGVKMSSNRALNEGRLDQTVVVIKCAKSEKAPIQVSKNTLDRVQEVWGVFLDDNDDAHIWKISASDFRKAAYYYSPRQGIPHYQIRLHRLSRIATASQIGTVGHKDVQRCEIP